jgi:hypothetical protein
MALANFKEACEPDIEFHGHVWSDYYELPNQVFATMRRVAYKPE